MPDTGRIGTLARKPPCGKFRLRNYGKRLGLRESGRIYRCPFARLAEERGSAARMGVGRRDFPPGDWGGFNGCDRFVDYEVGFGRAGRVGVVAVAPANAQMAAARIRKLTARGRQDR